VLNDIGYVHAVLGHEAKAHDYYQEALPFSQKTDDRSLEALILHNIARLERSRGDVVQALHNIEAAIKITEAVRTNVSSLELRTSYLASNHQNYELYIDLLMQQHQAQPMEGFEAAALQASERARSRSLLESLAETRADIREGIDPTLLERERSL